MKSHLPLVIALLTISTTAALLLWFFSGVWWIETTQANQTVQLPVAPREKADTIDFKLTTEGIAFGAEKTLSDARLVQLIAGNPGKRVLIEAAPDVNYEQAKALVQRLKAAGAKDVTFKIDQR
jgi:biopolymer transport protein ExbD